MNGQKRLTDSQQRRVLITRLSHIGDCVLTLPLVCAIKDQDPSAWVAWCVEKPADQLIRSHRAVDELIVVRREYWRSPRQLRELRQRLKMLRCNIALDPQSLTKSAMLARLSSAKNRIGLGGAYGRELSPLLNNQQVKPTTSHLLDRTLELLPPVGLEIPPPTFDLPTDESAERGVEAFTAASHLGCGYVVINPGASWVSKRWIPRRYASVARYLGEQHRIPSVVTWSGAEERTWAEEIGERSGGNAVVAPHTSLPELASLLRRAHFFIGSDTGPLHIAAAVGTPCIGLYGPTRPQDSGAYGIDHLAVQKFYQSGNRKTRKSLPTAMNAIEVDDVTAACETMIEKHSVTADRQAA